jgi:hypothetical protein
MLQMTLKVQSSAIKTTISIMEVKQQWYGGGESLKEPGLVEPVIVGRRELRSVGTIKKNDLSPYDA